MLIYTAGPYRSKNCDQICRHIAAAKIVALQIFDLGHYAVCPHLNTAHFDDCGVREELILAGCKDLVSRCDAVLMFGDWEISEGALMEKDAARASGKPVFESLETLAAWLAGQDTTKLELRCA